MKRVQSRIYGYTDWQLAVIGVIIALALVLVIYLIISGEKNNPFVKTIKNPYVITTTTSGSVYTTLPPATVPSKLAECSQTVTYASDGAPGPLQCAGGNLNALAWDALSAQEPKVMSLGYAPTLSQVIAAICSDVNASASDSKPGADNAIESSAYQIAALYYGWNFSPSPTGVLTDGGC
jgi:hypothetical protein